jgi:SAM-dependent methyltransferase
MAEFDRFADNYAGLVDESTALSGETSEYFVRYKVNYLTTVLGRGARNILDYGCGVGTLSAALSEELPESTIDGFDVSTSSLAKVDRKLAARGVFTSDFDDLRPHYDLIVVSNVLHHIERRDRQDVVTRLSARLAEGARILIFEHNPLNPLTRLVVSRCPFDEGVKLLSPAEITRYFRDARLRRVRRDYIVFFPRSLARLRPIEHRFRWCAAGAQFAMLGQKDAAALP